MYQLIATGWTTHKPSERVGSDAFDFCALHLSAQVASKFLSHFLPLPIEYIDATRKHVDSKEYTFIGYPSHSTKVDPLKFVTRSSIYQCTSTAIREVQYKSNKLDKSNTIAISLKGDTRNPVGISGGGVWMDFNSPLACVSKAKLVGIATTHLPGKKILAGVRIAHVLECISKYYGRLF